jgi:hypothetical protein
MQLRIEVFTEVKEIKKKKIRQDRKRASDENEIITVVERGTQSRLTLVR